MKLVVIASWCLWCYTYGQQLPGGNSQCTGEDNRLIQDGALSGECDSVLGFRCGIQMHPCPSDGVTVNTTESVAEFRCYYDKDLCPESVVWYINGKIGNNDNNVDELELHVTSLGKGSQLCISGFTRTKHSGNHSVTCSLIVGGENYNETTFLWVNIPSISTQSYTFPTTTLEDEQKTTAVTEGTQSNIVVIVAISATLGAAVIIATIIAALCYCKCRRKAEKSREQRQTRREVTANEYADSSFMMRVNAESASPMTSSEIPQYEELAEVQSPRRGDMINGATNHQSHDAAPKTEFQGYADIEQLCHVYTKPNKKGARQKLEAEAEEKDAAPDLDQLYSKPNKNKQHQNREVASKTRGDDIEHLYAKPDKKNKQHHKD